VNILSGISHYQELIMNIIGAHAPGAKIILYGSRARNDWSEGSDIDVALDMGKKIDTNVLNAIINDIEESILPINFDIVDLHNVSEAMRQEILKDGIVWQK